MTATHFVQTCWISVQLRHALSLLSIAHLEPHLHERGTWSAMAEAAERKTDIVCQPSAFICESSAFCIEQRRLFVAHIHTRH